MANHEPTRTSFGDMTTMEGAAERLGVSKDSVRRYIASGALEAYRVGPPPMGKLRDVRPIRIPVAAVDSLLHPIVGGASRASAA